MKEAAIIIGASSGLGRALAYYLAEKGFDCILVSRNEQDLNIMATDLQRRFNIEAKVIPLDLAWLNEEKTKQFVDDCFNHFSNLNQVYITAAITKDEDDGAGSINVLDEITAVNYKGVAYLVAGFAKKMMESKSNITVISSIAAIRPRGRNVAYAASKVALEYFVRGLQHFYAGKPMRLQVYRIGYMNTAMSRDKKLLFKKKDPAKVARHIVKRRNAAGRLKYYPRYWSMIAILLKMMPWFIYKKIKF